MPEPFKNRFNPTAIRAMSHHLARVAPDFDHTGFIDHATKGLDDLELKERASQLTDALEAHLPDDFPQAAAILTASLDPQADRDIGTLESGVTDRGIQGWPVMAMADFVARRGQGHVELSLQTLKEMTSRFTAEFAIRPFLVEHPERTLQTLETWLEDTNEHVRRLVSEGTRSRLPWGIRLQSYVKDPAPVIALLERLKDDPSEYVRRSVANNLNDIAKDHPDTVATLAQAWMKDASPERQKLVKHALRTLIKAGHPGALKALGYAPAKVELESLILPRTAIALGEAVEFTLTLTSRSPKAQNLIIDYAVHHMRANGVLSPKVFKWKTLSLDGGKSLNATRRHAIRPVTTRRYYSGRHRLEILVNGQSLGFEDFELHVPSGKD